MVSNSAPMICALANGNIPGEDSWSRQDFQEGYSDRDRAARRFARKARRAGRRKERGAWMVEVTEELAA
jgi:hypothetical protein